MDDDESDTILCLIDEIKSEDHTTKLNAIKSLETIAQVIGQERTREELVPYTAELLDDDNEETVYTVTDENGCSTDPDIFREWQYDREKGFLTATFDAFKFPDSNTIKFKCNIRVCFGPCQPQNCAGRNAFGRRRRETEHEIEGSVYTGQLREEIQVHTSAWTKRSVKKQYIIPFDFVTRWS